jgi:hypothetical protein
VTKPAHGGRATLQAVTRVKLEQPRKFSRGRRPAYETGKAAWAALRSECKGGRGCASAPRRRRAGGRYRKQRARELSLGLPRFPRRSPGGGRQYFRSLIAPGEMLPLRLSARHTENKREAEEGSQRQLGRGSRLRKERVGQKCGKTKGRRRKLCRFVGSGLFRQPHERRSPRRKGLDGRR